MRFRVAGLAPAIVLALALPSRAADGGAAPVAQAASLGTDDSQVAALAKSSVDARFVPDPQDPTRDLVTGDSRDELELAARRHYLDLLRRDPAQYERMRGRVLGQRSASELQAYALSELQAGRPASAEQAWRRLVEEHPEAPEAGPAMVKLASSRMRAGERAGAAEDLARVPELSLQAAAEAEPLMSRLLADAEAELAGRNPPPSGRDRVVLHPSLASTDLDHARELSEWTDGWELLDEIARTLRLETSGDLLRKIKKLGQDDIRLDTIAQLIPLEERKKGVEIEETLKDPTSPQAAQQRAAARCEGKQLERFEGLSRLMQAQVLLLAHGIEALEIEPASRQLAARTLAERAALESRVEALIAADPRTLKPGDAAVARLAKLSDANRDGKLTMLRDDEGMWKPHRPAVEGDMRNAVDKKLDDDSDRGVADLFERMGMSEKALFHALVTACDGAQPDQVNTLLATLATRSAPVWAAARPKGRADKPGDAERDYLARLNVLRLPGETLAEIIRRELIDADAPTAASPGAVAQDPDGARLVAELASLGRKYDGAWLFEDDAPSRGDDDPRVPPPGHAMTASEKLARAQLIRAKLDDIAATQALDALSDSLATDLESQGMHLGAGGVAALKQRVQHEDLGSLAVTFDELGNFTGIQNLVAFTEPGAGLGELGPGHVAYGFGLDLKTGAPAGTLGWRASKDVRDGRASLRYHVGATGLPAAPTDVAGASIRMRQREVWQPEIGGDASFLRGLGGRGFLNLIRDVTLKHQRALDAVCAEHERAKKEGRGPFVSSLTAPDAAARPATLFTESLGYDEDDFANDSEAYLVLDDEYEFEKLRQKSLLNREAGRVRFAGFGVSAAFLAGDFYLLAGPKLAFKDFRLFSHFMEGPERRLQGEEAELRRIAVPQDLRRGQGERRTIRTQLVPSPDSDGRARFVADEPDVDVAFFDPGAPFLAPATTEGARVASLGMPRLGPAASPAAAPAPVSSDDDDRALRRLNAWLVARGVPLEIRATPRRGTYALAPMGLAPWASHSIDFYVAPQDDALGLSLAADGTPLLVAPVDLDGVVVDWLEETRAITRPGESDQVHRACFSLAPGRPASRVIEDSANLLRTDVVDGRLVGTARIATRHCEPDGTPRVQANLVLPGDESSETRLAELRERADERASHPLPQPPPIALVRSTPEDDGTISDPAELSPAFLDALRNARQDDVVAAKRRSIHLAVLRSEGQSDRTLDPQNVEYVQALSLSHHGRVLSGAALERANWVLIHDGLFRADGGSSAQQIAFFESRGVTPFEPGREMESAADPITRSLLSQAGIDEAAALAALRDRMADAASRARSSGELPRETVPAGTRIVTASQSGTSRGVQWTTSDGTTEAHLLPPLSLSTNEGRYVTALALGADVPALSDALRAQGVASTASSRGERAGNGDSLQDDLVTALARALASPESERTLVATLPGATLQFTLAQAPRAGALARCKNATLFPPAYGVDLRREASSIVAGGPVTTIGVAEAGMRFSGSSWAGWRTLSALLGAPLLAGRDHHSDDEGGGGGGGVEPPPEPPPPRTGIVPPARTRQGGVGPRESAGDVTGKRPDQTDEQTPGEPRPGAGTPGRGGGAGRGGEPPDAGGDRKPPDDGSGQPRPGDDTPPPRDGNRPSPPDPSDRPRRPVD